MTSTKDWKKMFRDTFFTTVKTDTESFDSVVLGYSGDRVLEFISSLLEARDKEWKEKMELDDVKGPLADIINSRIDSMMNKSGWSTNPKGEPVYTHHALVNTSPKSGGG